MGLFNFFKPDVEELIKRNDIDGLLQLVNPINYQRDPTNTMKAVVALGDIGDRKSTESLINFYQKYGSHNFDDEISIALSKIRDPSAINFIINRLRDDKNAADIVNRNKSLDDYAKALDDNPNFDIVELYRAFDLKRHYQFSVFNKLLTKMNKKKIDQLFNYLRVERDVEKKSALFNILSKNGNKRILEYGISLIKSGETGAYIFNGLSHFKDSRVPQIIIDEIERLSTDFSSRSERDRSIKPLFNALLDINDPRVVKYFIEKLNFGDLQQSVFSDFDYYSSIYEYFSKIKDPQIAEHFQIYLDDVVKTLSTEEDDIDYRRLIYRREAINYLGNSKNPGYSSSIIPFLKDDHILIRQAAAAALDNLSWNPNDDTKLVAYLFAKKLPCGASFYLSHQPKNESCNDKRFEFYKILDERDWDTLLTYPDATKNAILDFLYQIPFSIENYPQKFNSICRDLFGSMDTLILMSASYEKTTHPSGHGYVNSIDSAVYATKLLCQDKSPLVTSILKRIACRKDVYVRGQAEWVDLPNDYDGWVYRTDLVDFSQQRNLAIIELQKRESQDSSHDNSDNIVFNENIDSYNAAPNIIGQYFTDTPVTSQDSQPFLNNSNISVDFNKLSRAEIAQFELTKKTDENLATDLNENIDFDVNAASQLYGQHFVPDSNDSHDDENFQPTPTIKSSHPYVSKYERILKRVEKGALKVNKMKMDKK